jgi:hypothetical protein
MLSSIKYIIQLIAISYFVLLTIIGFIEKQYNFGVGLNFALVLLYIFLYLQPFK